jgi:hypothetical protein
VLEAEIAAIAASLEETTARLVEARVAAADAGREYGEAETAMAALRPRLCFRADLSDCVALCLVKRLRGRGGGLFAMVSRGFMDHDIVSKARELGMLKSGVLGISAGYTHTVALLDTGVYTFGEGEHGRLGHGGEEDELVPRVCGGAGREGGGRRISRW